MNATRTLLGTILAGSRRRKAAILGEVSVTAQEKCGGKHPVAALGDKPPRAAFLIRDNFLPNLHF